MSLEAFFVSDTNPNDNCGGGGCVCSREKAVGCEGPYVIFPNVDTDWYLSPNTVISASCLRAAVAALDGEALAAGEKADVESTADEIVNDDLRGYVDESEDIPEV